MPVNVRKYLRRDTRVSAFCARQKTQKGNLRIPFSHVKSNGRLQIAVSNMAPMLENSLAAKHCRHTLNQTNLSEPIIISKFSNNNKTVLTNISVTKLNYERWKRGTLKTTVCDEFRRNITTRENFKLAVDIQRVDG